MNFSRLFSVTITVFLAICFARVSNAADLTLQWDPPSDSTATGYILYYGTGAGSYTQQVDVGNNSVTTVNGLSNGTTYYFAVRAYDASGATSDASAEVFAMIAAGVPPIVVPRTRPSGQWPEKTAIPDETPGSARGRPWKNRAEPFPVPPFPLRREGE